MALTQGPLGTSKPLVLGVRPQCAAGRGGLPMLPPGRAGSRLRVPSRLQPLSHQEPRPAPRCTAPSLACAAAGLASTSGSSSDQPPAGAPHWLPLLALAAGCALSLCFLPHTANGPGAFASMSLAARGLTAEGESAGGWRSPGVAPDHPGIHCMGFTPSRPVTFPITFPPSPQFQCLYPCTVCSKCH